MTIFFTADTHFFHKNIITFSNRPYTDVAHMNERLIFNWNDTVAKQDFVYHLGDISFGPVKDTIDILKQLNGTIILINGNHDYTKYKYDNLYPVYERFTIKDKTLCDVPIILDHYPIEDWNYKYQGSIHLHGHSHGLARKIPNRYDVGVDVQNYKPVTLREIIQ